MGWCANARTQFVYERTCSRALSLYPGFTKAFILNSSKHDKGYSYGNGAILKPISVKIFSNGRCGRALIIYSMASDNIFIHFQTRLFSSCTRWTTCEQNGGTHSFNGVRCFYSPLGILQFIFPSPWRLLFHIMESGVAWSHSPFNRSIMCSCLHEKRWSSCIQGAFVNKHVLYLNGSGDRPS